MADIWDNLNTTEIGEEPGSVIDVQTRRINLERNNKQLLSDVNLINQATFRTDGAPIPGTAQVVSSGSLAENVTKSVLLTPAKGEVWMVCALSSTKNTVTTMNFQFGVEDTVNTAIAYLCDFNITSGIGPINEGGFVTPIFLDENCKLIFNATKISGSYGDYTADALVVRLR